MKKYSIMPIMPEHAEQIADDIERQYSDGIADEALFSMTLTPEGDPVVDKAVILCEKLDPMLEVLRRRGRNAGILVQATIGHGGNLSQRAPFQHVVSLLDGRTLFRVCPYDEGFRDYLRRSMATLATRKPTSIMIDDDFRLFATSHRGCACPLHLKALSKLLGYEISREELLVQLNERTYRAREMMRRFMEVQVDSLIGAARAIREGIDEVDPRLQGSFCLCGDTAEGAGEIGQILAGEGNPVILRINNGNYTPLGAKNISSVMHRCATQMAVIGKNGDCFLAETDTCPHNRHSTSAANLHTHFTVSILEGVAGCKHWITKLDNFEPKSGIHYRKKLSEYSAFYEELARIVPTLKWRGCRIPLVGYGFVPTTPVTEYKHPSSINAWAGCVLEKLGLPLYFSDKAGGVACLDGRKDEFFDDGQVLDMLRGPIFLAAESAQNLISRGFGKYLGVNVEDIDADDTGASIEVINGHRVRLQNNLKRLVPTSDKCVSRSTVFATPDGAMCNTRIPLFPAVTEFENELGGRVFVFSGTPEAPFDFRSFSFLGEARKQQLIDLIRECGELPVYYPDDADVLIKAAEMPGGETFCAFINLTLDRIENITLISQSVVNGIEYLTPDGKWAAVKFSESEDVITLDLPAEILHPVILKLS